MQYKNIIFDLGNVLVKLNPEGCIGAFKEIGMGELVDSNPHEQTGCGNDYHRRILRCGS